MKMHNAKFIAVLAYVALLSSETNAAPPRVTNDKYRLELVAAEPEIVTPIGMAFDRQGRLLVVESHTHQDPDEYKGPERDRLRMLADSDGDGRLHRWSTFAEGFRHAMNVLVREDGAVYLVERGRLLLLRDTNDDGIADGQDVLLRLETEDDYPHNALGGIDFAPDGSLIIGLGENHGLPFRLIGSDGKEIVATGGLDGFFRCSVDGKNIEHFARGVWNPFSLCILPDGRIFAVDNDPDASPPCRLLHVVEGGDYGYLYQYGRAGTHPLQCWNGELPGTLPMVCGTGEAPTAIVDHAGSLWVTSWGDHRIERYQLTPRGASFGATREVVVQGDADFRPTGMAVAPDGSLYIGDWVLRDYPVHGRGRIWRLILPEEEIKATFSPRTKHGRHARADSLSGSLIGSRSADPFARAQSNWGFSRYDDWDEYSSHLAEIAKNFKERLAILEAWRLRGTQKAESILRAALNDISPDIRLFAVRWIADDRIISLRDEVARLLDGPQPDARYYLAVLAAIDWLDNEPEMRGRDIADELLVRELQNTKRSSDTHTLALGLLSPDNEYLTVEQLTRYLKSKHRPLRLAAIRSLSQRTKSDRFELLAAVAGDEGEYEEIRAEAVMGLSAAAEKHKELLESLARANNETVAREAERALRLSGLHPVQREKKPRADDLAAWSKLLNEPGDVQSGQRLFFSPVAARCGVCHEHSGRGGRIGPDLTSIAKSSTREKLIASILDPDQEIAPHCQPWLLVTDDGKTHTGLRMHEGGDDGSEEYVNSTGERFLLESKTIEVREATATSIMPSGLEKLISIADLRDLVTFLMESK
ncbi:MAG TPA: PVC-type heme-binding CxxCH protein [Lacipirellulaceae bacterium]